MSSASSPNSSSASTDSTAEKTECISKNCAKPVFSPSTVCFARIAYATCSLACFIDKSNASRFARNPAVLSLSFVVAALNRTWSLFNCASVSSRVVRSPSTRFFSADKLNSACSIRSSCTAIPLVKSASSAFSVSNCSCNSSIFCRTSSRDFCSLFRCVTNAADLSSALALYFSTCCSKCCRSRSRCCRARSIFDPFAANSALSSAVAASSSALKDRSSSCCLPIPSRSVSVVDWCNDVSFSHNFCFCTNIVTSVSLRPVKSTAPLLLLTMQPSSVISVSSTAASS